MTTRRRRGLLLGSLLAGLLVAGVFGVLSQSGPRLAATTPPPWEPDCGNALGSVSFYDEKGHQVTSGRVDASPFAVYAVASGPGRPGDNMALLQIFTPLPGVNPGLWQTGDQMTATTAYPPVHAPQNVVDLGLPTVTGSPTDIALQDHMTWFPNTQTDPAYANLYQVRILTSSPTNGVNTLNYFRADILVDPATNTWSQVYPVPGDRDACQSSPPSASASGSSPSPSPTPGGGGVPTTATTATTTPPQNTPTDRPADQATSASPESPTPDAGAEVPVLADTPSLSPGPTVTPSPSSTPGESFVPVANPSGPIGGPLAQTGSPMNVAAVGGLALVLVGTGLVALLRRVLRDDSWPPYA